MTPEAIRQVLKELLAALAPEADLDDLRPGETLRKGLDLDSYDFLQLLVGVEERIGVTVPEADYAKVLTLEGLISYLQQAAA